MKAFYKIHDKPRGRWRPLLEWGISFSPQEEQEAEALNLDKDIDYCLRLDLGDFADNKHAGKICAKGFFLLPFPGKTYSERSRQEGESYAMGNACNCSCSESCFFVENGKYSRSGLSAPATVKLRLEWRPGRRPDYSDYIEPLRIFLRCLLKEAERRFTEVRESTPSDEWLLEEEFDSFSWRTTEDGMEVAERKLRVIRK